MGYTHTEILQLFSKIGPRGKIADLGSGPEGAFWWNYVPNDCSIDAYDLFNEPKNITERISFYKEDATSLYKKGKLEEHYDIVIADHIFEHVINPNELAASIYHILKNYGYVHIGIPDATNFTDRFYRLIHRDGGGHVSQFSKDSFTNLMIGYGFELISIKPWPDDWVWLEKLYSLEDYGIKHLMQDELQYVVDVFRKELTIDKGYIYGWEYLFRKESSKPAKMSTQGIESAKIVNIFPQEIELGQVFNLQPNGKSALWVDAENATVNTVIVFDNIQLETTFGNKNVLTAIVPEELYASKGNHKVVLFDRLSNIVSNEAFLIVNENTF